MSCENCVGTIVRIWKLRIVMTGNYFIEPDYGQNQQRIYRENHPGRNTAPSITATARFSNVTPA